LVAAGVAAVALIGTTVAVGVLGNAVARDAQVATVANEECLPDVSNPTGSQTTTTPTQPAPSTAQESSPVQQEPPASEVPSQAPTEVPSQLPPADEQPPSTGGEQGGYAVQPQGFRLRPQAGSAHPPTSEGQEPAHQHQPEASQPASPGSQPPAATSSAPDEKGAIPPTTPPEQPQAQATDRFGAPDCTQQLGPFPQDFVNIRMVSPSAMDPSPGPGASRGSFVSQCGTNENGHQNPDNFIVAPGKANGAHHLHDYVGNLDSDANSTNESLLAAGTTCRAGDKSTYFWPVLRVRDPQGGSQADPVNVHNVGTVLRPASVRLQFRGNAIAKVEAMPTFLRIITGDAKAATNGGANGNAKWTCTGFPGRFTTKYPLCPRGSQVQRVLDFASCWDGANIDSANHRDHVVFPENNGACPQGTKPIPQLRMTLTYNVPRRAVFAVDAFPDQLHSPVTDHGDFVNVMPDDLMTRAVTCVNSGRNC
jgi:hypothetical protein